MQENNSNWKELDFKVASDYTHGGPEYYRTRLRQMLGIPTLLPGEKNDLRTKRHHTPNSTEIPSRRNMSSFFHKNKG